MILRVFPRSLSLSFLWFLQSRCSVFVRGKIFFGSRFIPRRILIVLFLWIHDLHSIFSLQSLSPLRITCEISRDSHAKKLNKLLNIFVPCTSKSYYRRPLTHQSCRFHRIHLYDIKSCLYFPKKISLCILSIDI